MIFLDSAFRPGWNAGGLAVRNETATTDSILSQLHEEGNFTKNNMSSNGGSWKRMGLREYIGVPISANSTLTASVVAEITSEKAHLIIDTGCPGTMDHSNVIDEAEFYTQMAALMDEESHFVELNWGLMKP